MSPQPHLTLAIVAAVIGAGALHAAWNAIAKHVPDRLMAFAWIGIASATTGAVVLSLTGLPARAAVPFAIASAVIHVAYELALINSYRLGAFNQTYPIARGTSPLVVAVGAYFLAGEHLGAVALAGIATLAAGLIGLAFSAGRLTRQDSPAVGAAILTGLTIAAYTLVDGIGVRRAGDPWAYTALLFALQGPPLTIAAAIRRPASAWRDRLTLQRGLIAGLLCVVAYGVVLWAQTKAPLAEVAAIRETSVVFGALIGLVVLGEDFGKRRIAAAAVIAAGILLISM
ncbi:MAG TPA: EamA family transporter [Streptosporangiaceae bacterium]|nr:EamA family transporter [Streptosporangiaceae bacterium]